MTRTRFTIAAGTAAVAVALSLVSCGSSSAESDSDRPMLNEEQRRPGMDFPLDGVASICDRFGNRVYRLGRPGGSYGSVYVVPDDCSKNG